MSIWPAALRRTALALAVAVHAALAFGATGEEARRRGEVLGLLDSTSAMILRAPEARMRSGDVQYPYRQDSHLLYLTGVNSPGITLLIAPRGIPCGDTTAQVVLFVPRSADEAFPAVAGHSDMLVQDASQFSSAFQALLPLVTVLHASGMQPAFMQDWLNSKPLFVERESRRQLEKSYPSLKIRNAGSLISRLREIKSAVEVKAIEQSIGATGEGLHHAMRICRPGMMEYELQAAVEYEMVRRGAAGPAFQSIVGSGPNGLILHYDRNNRRMRDGELVVMDVGAEIGGYAADVTRTIPVSGTFSKEQRTVYDAVLRAQQAVVNAIRPGLPWAELDATARRSLTAEGFDRYWKHPVSHHLGLDVHDVGRLDTLRAGMVITVEPGVYIPIADSVLSKAYRGLGVRIEDDVLVTDRGSRVLSDGILRDARAIEQYMKKNRTR